MSKVLLCIPPDYDRNYPPLGTPALSAFLKKRGIPCGQVDLNIGYSDFLARHITGPLPFELEKQRFFLEPLLNKFFIEKLQGRYYSAFLPRAGDGFFPEIPYNNNSNSSFYFCERLISSEYLWRYLEDRDENTFYRFYETSDIFDRLDKEDIDLLGISIISPTQVIASLTLGQIVKKRFPHIHVVIGGPWATLYRNSILEKKELFRCFDSVIVFEGESALCELAQRLDAKKEIASIPNIIVQNTVGDISLTRREEDMDLLPCPDYDGLPLQEYGASQAGEVSLPYETSRGCYWSKCAYCVDVPLPRPTYRRKDPALVADDMKELERRYGAEYLLFGDPGLSPRQMRQISKEILRKGVDMWWWTMARLDPGFGHELFALAHKAGLRQVNFGFESASDRICGLLDKGNSRERSSRIIKDCAKAGIRVDLQTMLGLPGESFEDGMETVDFLLSHGEYLSQATFNTYYLTPNNRIHQDPGSYGICFEDRPDLPFRFFIPFKNIRGMDMEHARLLEKIYRSLAARGAKEKPADTPPSSIAGDKVSFTMNGETCTLGKRDELIHSA